ncbi:Molecular chaperone (DnaJ superfamily) [Handroanthus impetiginosus]|uniref:Molecular chaperone (DnaJ superfamily) n=1 Tax=Handroanthus impetiginosus TaxID=429701 RepID=A0A2G9HU27_9LAMI|nr:Molecular chaperone (DnaJ superfamily) [Handroanthus impetiginosus]
MSPPRPTSYPTVEIGKADCPLTQNLESSGSFNFAAGSTDAAGFNYSKSGPQKPNHSSRPRPRLIKVRRKQVAASQDGKSVKTDLGLNEFSDVSGENTKLDGKYGNVFAGNNINSGSNGSANNGNLNGNVEQRGNGFDFGVSLNESLFDLGLGNGKSSVGSSMNSSTSNSLSEEGDFLFASNKGSSNVDVQKESGSFVFGANKAGSTPNQNLPERGSVFGPGKSGLPMDTNLESEQFTFGVNASESGLNFKFCAKESKGNLRQQKVQEFPKSDNVEYVFDSHKKKDLQDSNKSSFHFSVDEFGKVNRAKFVFGASKNASPVINSDPQRQDSSKSMDMSESDKDVGNTVPDMRGKVKLDASGDSEKVCHPSFESHFNLSDSTSKNHVNFVFGSNKSDSKPEIDLANNPTGKSGDSGEENAEIEIQYQNAGLNGVFIFGGLKGKGGLDSGGNTKLVNEMNQSNRGKNEDCNGFGQHYHGTGSDINSKRSSSSGGSFENPAFSIEDEMKRLNIGDCEGDAKKTENFNSNFSVNTNAFVFRKDQKSSKFMKENHPVNIEEKTPDMSHLFPSVDGGFCETPSMIKDEKDSKSFTSILAELDSDFSTNMKLDIANSKSLGGKRLKKKNGKLIQRTVVQQLLGQDRLSKDGTTQQNQSPGCGSPMDFSPYHGPSAYNAPDADFDTEVKVEFAEKKKYKLKVGSNHTVQSNNSDKENVKREPIGPATHEVCEHWRIRGNEAYHAGKLSKAEEFYSMGINSATHVSTEGFSMEPILLCYSNRAATRMSLGRMREAIGDCTKAAELDPVFLKATLRAGNCYLVLGEVEDAIQCYTKCLSLGTGVCLDRRVTIEAADGLQKAKRVAEYMQQSAKLLQEGTENAASYALGNIADALSISRYSEKLLEMKGKALYILRMYDEVIHLCEQTLDIAVKNFGVDHFDDPSYKRSHVKLWRWHLQTKSHYRLGRLDLALDLIEKQEEMPINSMSGDVTWEATNALAATIRELLSLKRLGNEAFNSGRYTEAIENYTSAISKSSESRPFMAICFCNRAAAYQAMGQIVDAIADCSLAIALNENYQKAISRRATLYEMIRDYKLAVSDLQRLISLLECQSQSKNQQHDSSRLSAGSARDLRKARRHLSLVEDKAKRETPLDLYLILGIKASDAESEIKKAYRKAALRHHPDKAGQVLARSDVGDDATLWKEIGEKIHTDADRLFKIIGEAYAVLSDPSKRSKYDSEEEIRNIYRDSNRNSNSGHPSTSYSSHERGSWYGRQAGFSTSFERNNSRRYWYDSRSYGSSHRW